MEWLDACNRPDTWREVELRRTFFGWVLEVWESTVGKKARRKLCDVPSGTNDRAYAALLADVLRVWMMTGGPIELWAVRRVIASNDVERFWAAVREDVAAIAVRGRRHGA